MASFSQKDEGFRRFALTGSPLVVLVTTCAPLALFQALQGIFKILDTLMAAHIGAEAVSAVAALSQVTLMVNALGSGLAVGGSIKIAESYGRGDHEEVGRRVSTLYAMAILVSAGVALTLIPFAEGFLRLLKTPQALIAQGAGYFRIEIATLVIQFFNTVFIAITRSRGRSRQILVLNLAVILTKLGLSALFVYGFSGGVVMIALATLISQTLLLAFALICMARDDGAFRFSPRNICWKRETVWPMVNLAYPVTAEKMLFSAGKVMVNAMSGLYGSLTVGALGISNNIGGLTTFWHAGFADGAAPLISQNRGAGHYRRTLGFYGWLLVIQIAIGAAGMALVTQTLPWLARVFASSQEKYDPAFCQLIIDIHRWEMLGYITLGISSATQALLLGYGYTKLTMVLNTVRVFVFRVPVLWILQTFTQMGAEAVGVTMMVSNISTGLLAVVFAIPILKKIRRQCRLERG